MPADTKLKICSRASILMGGDPITALDDSTAEAVVADDMYEDIIRDLLVNTRWRFAAKQQQLTTSGAAPLSRYDYEYPLPEDSLMVHAVTVNDCDIVYDIYDGLIHCNNPASDTVICHYTYRALEANWPAYFTLAAELAMASMFAVAIARDAQLANLIEGKRDRQLYRARRLDSQTKTTKNLDMTGLIRARF